MPPFARRGRLVRAPFRVGAAGAALVVAIVALLAAGTTSRAGTSIALRDIRQGLFEVCFATERDGWMIGELGRIFHTTDGGRTWERQDAATKRALLTVGCLDARTAWIAGKEGVVYGTTDGGATWTPASTGSNRHLFSIRFATPQRGHAVGDFGTMVHTEDGGRTWSVTRVPPEFTLPETAIDTGVDPGDVNLYAIAYGDPDHVWVVGEFGMIMASTDGGQTFQQQHTPVESTLFGVHFADARRGWAVGIDAVILQTDDGGASWRIVPPPIAQRSFYDVSVAGSHGWIVGDAGTVLASSDGGGSWRVQPLPIQLAANWIRSVALTPTGRGLAVGAEGLVFGIDGDAFRRLGMDAPQGPS
jgi:photosystem II stability/assembly factor-like uncharacterized protein